MCRVKTAKLIGDPGGYKYMYMVANYSTMIIIIIIIIINFDDYDYNHQMKRRNLPYFFTAIVLTIW